MESMKYNIGKLVRKRCKTEIERNGKNEPERQHLWMPWWWCQHRTQLQGMRSLGLPSPHRQLQMIWESLCWRERVSPQACWVYHQAAWRRHTPEPSCITKSQIKHKSQFKKENESRTYIHKTVMELEPHNRGNASGFLRKGPSHLISDYHFCIWTCFWVKPRSEIRWCHHLHKEHHNHAHHHPPHLHPHAHVRKDAKDSPFLILKFLPTVETGHRHRHWSDDAYIWFVSAQLLLTHFFKDKVNLFLTAKLSILFAT